MKITLAGIASLMLLSVAGCAGETDEELIPPDPEHVALFADLQLAEARAEHENTSIDSLRAVVLENHGLDSIALAGLIADYASDPEQATALYEAVGDTLASELRRP